jgi:hypothetical protein
MRKTQHKGRREPRVYMHHPYRAFPVVFNKPYVMSFDINTCNLNALSASNLIFKAQPNHAKDKTINS